MDWCLNASLLWCYKIRKNISTWKTQKYVGIDFIKVAIQRQMEKTGCMKKENQKFEQTDGIVSAESVL